MKGAQADEANVTLCPILDFANHEWHHSHIQPISGPDTRNARPKAAGAFQFFATEHIIGVEIGEEVCLRYGGHSNQGLFVEYGFVNSVSDEEMESGTYPAEVDVQIIVTALFEERGAIGLWMRAILENEGYWGLVPRDTGSFVHSYFVGTGGFSPHRTPLLLRFV